MASRLIRPANLALANAMRKVIKMKIFLKLLILSQQSYYISVWI